MLVLSLPSCAGAETSSYTMHPGLISAEWGAHQRLLEPDLSPSVSATMSARELMMPSNLQMEKLCFIANACQPELLRPCKKHWGRKKIEPRKMKSRELETVIHLVQTPKLVVWGEEVGG